MYTIFKSVHLLTILATITLFVLRFIQNNSGSTFWRTSRWRTLPHINDTLLLASGIGLMFVTGWSVPTHFWLTLKLILVVFYILVGWFAMRPNQAKLRRNILFVLTILIFCAIGYLAGNRLHFVNWPSF